MRSDAKPGARNGRIDTVRGVSILLVLLHHFALAYSLRGTALAHFAGWNAVHAVTRNGNYGVIMFFTISGYLITANSMRRWGGLPEVDLRGFYTLRAARILPSLVLLLVIVNALGFCGVAIFQNHPEQGPPVPVWLVDTAALTFWMNVLMARAGWLNYVLCVLWSLSVEEVFYLAFPLLCRGFRRPRSLLAFWLLCIVAGPIWRALHQDDEAQFLYGYLACFDAIAIGCFAAVVAARVTASASSCRIVRLCTAGAMAVLYLSAPIGRTNVLGVTLMAAGTAALLLAGQDKPTRRSGFPARCVQNCGRLSYELYLTHLLVLAGLRSVWPPDVTAGGTPLILLAVFLALSGSLGWLWARYYAEPANRAVRIWAAVA